MAQPHMHYMDYCIVHMHKIYTQIFYEQNFDELIVGFIGKTLREKKLVGKTLMNSLPFIKFVTLKLWCYTVFSCSYT